MAAVWSAAGTGQDDVPVFGFDCEEMNDLLGEGAASESNEEDDGAEDEEDVPDYARRHGFLTTMGRQAATL